MEEEFEYYNTKDIMKFLGLEYEFQNKEFKKDYPFNRDLETIEWMWRLCYYS